MAAAQLLCHETLPEEPPAKRRCVGREDVRVMSLPSGYLESLMSRAGYRECALVPQHAGFPGWRRRTVCQWILDVCFDRDYPNTVFAMAVAYMDAYLATVRAEKATYQCVGGDLHLDCTQVRRYDFAQRCVRAGSDGGCARALFGEGHVQNGGAHSP